MFFCMRTTLNLDDELMRAIKQRAAQRRTTITRVIEEAVRESLVPRQQRRARHKLHWRTDGCWRVWT